VSFIHEQLDLRKQSQEVDYFEKKLNHVCLATLRLAALVQIISALLSLLAKN
jgi:hypothetical protein